MSYKDMEVGDMFSTGMGIVFQKRISPFTLMVNTDGMQSSVLDIGGQHGQVNPQGIKNMCLVGKNTIFQLDGRWFYYLNEQRIDIQREDIVGFSSGISIKFADIENKDIAVTRSKINLIKYGSIDNCDILDKSEFYRNGILSKHAVGNNVVFVANDRNGEYVVVDGAGNELVFNIGELV